MKHIATFILMLTFGAAVLAITRKRSFLDIVRYDAVGEAAKLETEMLKVTLRDGVFQEFIDDRLKIGQGANARQGRHAWRVLAA